MHCTLQCSVCIQKLQLMFSIGCVVHTSSRTQNDLISINIRHTIWRRWKWSIDFELLRVEPLWRLSRGAPADCAVIKHKYKEAWCPLGGGKKTPLISALLLSAVFHGNELAKLDVSPLGKQHVLIQSQWRERAYDYNGLLLAIIGMKQTLRRDLETCELEMSAVHHSILQPAFSLQEQHGCLRITYTDASLHLHRAVLLLLEQKPLLGVKEKKSRPPKPPV